MIADSNTDVWIAMDSVAVLAADVAEIGQAFLSKPERMRLASVAGPHKRAQFLAGRLLMRRLLARVHGGDPLTDWPLTAAADAPPTFLGEAFAQRPGAPWRLSVTHGQRYVACAVSTSRVGIDIEVQDRERDILALGEVMCSVGELLALRALDEQERAQYFLALWTLKEAAIKCESGRPNSSALRMLASREITPADLTDALPRIDDDERRRHAASRHARSMIAGAWTWQSSELTLAVVADDSSSEPQWAMPPPAFILQDPSSWSISLVPQCVD